MATSPKARPAKKAAPRIKALKVLQRVPHRYRTLRTLTQAVTLVIMFAIPLSGLIRFDAWRGNHIALWQPRGGIMAAGGMLAAIVGFYLITFLLNVALGRVFCGYGCPVGQAARFGDLVDTAKKANGGVMLARAEQAGFAVLLSGAILLWWVDPRILWLGTANETLTAVGVWASLAVLVILHGNHFRWRFCRAYCPIGLYYSAVQVDHAFGVHFDPTHCENCDMCVRACPVNLDPKALEKPIENIGGVAIDGFPGAHHCLTCGDCIQACEYATQHNGEQLVPLRLSFNALSKTAASAEIAEKAGIDATSRECAQPPDSAAPSSVDETSAQNDAQRKVA